MLLKLFRDLLIQVSRVEFSVFFNKQLTAAPREIRVAL
jgi:hypothetical protein